MLKSMKMSAGDISAAYEVYQQIKTMNPDQLQLICDSLVDNVPHKAESLLQSITVSLNHEVVGG